LYIFDKTCGNVFKIFTWLREGYPTPGGQKLLQSKPPNQPNVEKKGKLLQLPCLHVQEGGD
jgi:hypothetical protein